MTEPPGLITVGPVVVLTGPAARLALDAVLTTIRSRRLSGMPTSGQYERLAAALLAACGRSDVPETPVAQSLSMPTITTAEAAARLGRSPRQIRRLAPRLGGRRVGGQWLIDAMAVAEHQEGSGG